MKIKDRNFELGECFEKSISFISYENATLRWESCANEECKKVLTHGYSVIKHLVREIFGFETKIKHEICSPQSPSMVEDVEVGTDASCISVCASVDSTKEIDGAKILEEPMVQRATELFEATKSNSPTNSISAFV